MISGILFAMVTLVQQDTAIATLPSVQVRVAREAARSVLELPYAVTHLSPDITRPGLRNASIDERLFLIPGVFIANRNNPTQDPRISIRGFGSRSAFGVRGVRVQMDGVPLTLPDGQTAIDYLDLESIGNLEIIRGSASSLYGNAAGGVIDLRSRPAFPSPFDARVTGWSATHEQRKAAIAAGGTSAAGDLDYSASFSQMESDGFRNHARQRITNGSLRAGAQLGALRVSAGFLAHDMPLAENPGALTLAEMRTNPEKAESLAVVKRARKDVSQQQLGLTFTLADNAAGASQGGGLSTRRELELVVHGGMRDLYNPLQFAIVSVERVSYGTTLRGGMELGLFGRQARLTAGVDFQRQDDDRTEFTNCNNDPPLANPTATCPVVGVERGSLRRDQNELVTSIGPYVRGEIEVVNRLWLSAGVRADRVNFEVRDAFITAQNPDDSGERTLSEVSPTVGLVYRTGRLNSVYATYATAFETPTATELGNQPDGTLGGFNPELEPQRSWTAEVGTRGWMRTFWPAGLSYDLAVFRTTVQDELIPFDIPGGAGRRFFRNAGSTRRVGYEASLATMLGPAELSASYTYSHFKFAEYVVNGVTLDGRRIPGIPTQQVQGAATFRRGAWYLTIEGEARGSVFMDDANTAATRVPGYELMHLRLGGEGIAGVRWLSPRVGVQNVFDRTYAASVAVNAERYLEPAPGRVFFAGLTVGGIR